MSAKQLPSHWKVLQLENVANLQRGKDLPQDKRQQGSYPVVGSNGIVGYHSDFMAHGPGVMVGRSGSVGKVTWIEGDYWALNTALWVKDFNGNYPLFINYFLDYLDLGKYTGGVSVPTLNRNIIHPLKVAVPPLPEQRAIAHTLRTIQKAKEARQRELELERERKAALMQYLFTHGTRNEPRQQTEIGEIPKPWQVVKLEKVIKDGPQNGIYKPLELYGAGIPIVRINDFDNNGAFATFNFQRVSLLSDEASKYRIAERDILINRVNSLSHLGKCALVPKLEETTVFESNMMRFHVDETRLMPEYLFRYLVTTECRNYLRSIAKRAVAQSSINQGDVKSLLIPVPDLSEQAEITGILSAVERKITALTKEISTLDELFRAMLSEFMTGQLSALPLIKQEN